MNVLQFKDLLNNKISGIRLTYEAQFAALERLPIKDRILLKYTFKVLNDLDNLLLETEDMGAFCHELQDYLDRNWTLIQGSCLCYTAIPKASITQLLFQMTHVLLPELNVIREEGTAPLSELELLMPGVNLISEKEEYPDLAVTEVALSAQEQAELAQIQHAMQRGDLPVSEIIFLGDEQDKTSERYKKTRYDEVKSLRTTNPQLFERIIQSLALPPELQEKIAQWERQKDYKILLKKQEAQQALIAKAEQGLVRIEGDYVIPCYTAEQICTTHILSSAKGALIPISVLLSDTQEMPYLDRMYGDPEDELFNQQREHEQQRLANHSELTKALVEAMDVVLRLQNDKSTLLGHLTELCNHLKYNDVYEGVGLEHEAGRHAYEPIRQFVEYYKTLGYQLTQDKDSLGDLFVGVEVSLNPDALGFQLHYSVKTPGALHQGTLTEKEFPSLMLIIKKLQQNNRALDGNVLFEELFTLQHDLFECLAHKGHLDFQLEEKSKIPEDLRAEIELLLNLSINPQANREATANLETCIARRRAALTALVNQHEFRLAAIHCSERSLAQQLQKAGQEVAHRTLLLKEALSNNYTGEDQLPITSLLMHQLDITITLDSLFALSELFRLNHRLVFTDESKEAVLALFNSMEVFYDFIREHSSGQVELLLEATRPVLLDEFCPSLIEIEQLLFAQTNEKFIVLFKELLLYGADFDIDEFFTNHPERLLAFKLFEQNEAAVIAMILKNSRLFKHLPERLRNNPRVVVAALHGDANALDDASERLRQDPCLIKISGISVLGDLKQSALNCYLRQDDIEFVIAEVQRNVQLLYYLPDELRANPRVVFAALDVAPIIKQRVINCYLRQEDIKFVAAEVKKNIEVLSYLPEKLRDNPRIVVPALIGNRHVLQYASARLRQDPCLINIGKIYHNNGLRRSAGACYLKQDDLKFLAAEVKKNIVLLSYLPEGLRDNPCVLVAALSVDKNALYFAPQCVQLKGKDTLSNEALVLLRYCIEQKCYEPLQVLLEQLSRAVWVSPEFITLIRSFPDERQFFDAYYYQLLQKTLDDMLNNKSWFLGFFCNYQKEFKKLKSELESGHLSAKSVELLQQGTLGFVIKAWSSCAGYSTLQELFGKFQELELFLNRY